MIGALAVGETIITGLLESEDVFRTAAAMRALGTDVTRIAPASWRLYGRGIGGLAEPMNILDMGNSGTGARLLMGLLASHPLTCVLTGDASLRARPMQRVMKPLHSIGACFLARANGQLPLAMAGTAHPIPIVHTLEVASAQVKSAVLLAGLNTPGTTTVIEPLPTRDHTERMLQGFGAILRVEENMTGGRIITLTGQPEISGRAVTVPADPSSAAFLAVAALLVPGGAVTLVGVCTNPLRSALYDTLREMGAQVEMMNARGDSDEPVADLVVRHAPLTGIDVPATRVPSMIDEYPVLAIAAACANGTTRMYGLAELRLKESDRLTAIARGLSACGSRVDIQGDTLIIYGNGRPLLGGARVNAACDHRIAMAFLVLGLVTQEPVTVENAQEAIATSFPNFVQIMNRAGANISDSLENSAR
ncbi:5-Enolpyruvylshikimate-3-phosphate synthase [invertebrate metagenome]|uniref:3-phosphoshikimate 1-carboxyvinyltransferase n=1 Tax=invertebrate metagenome TaxID=1711999 RepID=A0A484H7P1_9ZZZZ